MELKLRYIHNCEEERFKGAITVKRTNSIVRSNPTSENLFQKLFSVSSEILSEMHKTAITLKGNFLCSFFIFSKTIPSYFPENVSFDYIRAFCMTCNITSAPIDGECPVFFAQSSFCFIVNSLALEKHISVFVKV